MKDWQSIADIRREYGHASLDLDSCHKNPIIQFKRWFSEILETQTSDPSAMTLSTVDSFGKPDSRVVLLKGLEKDNFLFFTNYESTKAQQLKKHPFAALNFYWPCLVRQVRVRGMILTCDTDISDEYFKSRPYLSQCSAIVSKQSSEIKNRAQLELKLTAILNEYQTEKEIQRPSFWGGYLLVPDVFEFWQGRDNRLHDRIQYQLIDKSWKFRRLSP